MDELLWVLHVLKRVARNYPEGGIGVLTEAMLAKVQPADKESLHFYSSANAGTRLNYPRIYRQTDRAAQTGILPEILRVHPAQSEHLKQSAVYLSIERINQDILSRPHDHLSKEVLLSRVDFGRRTYRRGPASVRTLDAQ